MLAKRQQRRGDKTTYRLSERNAEGVVSSHGLSPRTLCSGPSSPDKYSLPLIHQDLSNNAITTRNWDNHSQLSHFFLSLVEVTGCLASEHSDLFHVVMEPTRHKKTEAICEYYIVNQMYLTDLKPGWQRNLHNPSIWHNTQLYSFKSSSVVNGWSERQCPADKGNETGMSMKWLTGLKQNECKCKQWAVLSDDHSGTQNSLITVTKCSAKEEHIGLFSQIKRKSFGGYATWQRWQCVSTVSTEVWHLWLNKTVLGTSTHN